MSTDLLSKGISLFNSSHYFEAHEVWEDLWRQSEGAAKDHCQGLIHAAVGLYHIQRGNRIGARSQLRKCLEKLRRNPALAAGIDNLGLIHSIAEIAQALEFSEAADEIMAATPGVRIERL